MRLLLLPVILLCLPLAAHAAPPCQNPSGDEGDQVYNITYHVMQYCNGSHWVAMGSIMGQGDNLGDHTAGQAINMSGFRIENLAPPTADNHAATRAYADTKISKAGDTMTGALNLSGLPTANPHATTKQYVDTVIASASSGGGAATCQVICNGTCPTAPSGWTLSQSTGQSGSQYTSPSAAGRCYYTFTNSQGYPASQSTERICCYFK